MSAKIIKAACDLKTGEIIAVKVSKTSMKHTDMYETWTYMWESMLGFSDCTETAISQCPCTTCKVQYYKRTLECLKEIEINVS